jgi:hypothetical protein
MVEPVKTNLYIGRSKPLTMYRILFIALLLFSCKEKTIEEKLRSKVDEKLSVIKGYNVISFQTDSFYIDPKKSVEFQDLIKKGVIEYPMRGGSINYYFDSLRNEKLKRTDSVLNELYQYDITFYGFKAQTKFAADNVPPMDTTFYFDSTLKMIEKWDAILPLSSFNKIK